MTQANRHPFLQGLSKHRGAPPTVLVIFGASGDLTQRKLVPALYNLALDNLLPSDFCLIGYGRKPIPDEQFQEASEEAIKKFSRRPINDSVWGKIKQNTGYHAGGYDEVEAFVSLKERIEQIQKEMKRDVQVVFYISTPPTVFVPIIQCLGKSGLSRMHLGTDLASKVACHDRTINDESKYALGERRKRHTEDGKAESSTTLLAGESALLILVLYY